MLFCATAFAQRQELAFTLGRVLATDRQSVKSSGGTGLQVNYGVRLWSNGAFAISGEVHFLASPLRDVSETGKLAATKDYASLYLTPGIRVKFHPNGRLQPFGVIGGGYALYEHSNLTSLGTVNLAPRHLNTGAFVYGGGVDVPVRKWLALRGEARDFYTGSPYYHASLVLGRQHNVVVSGGFVLRFGK